MTPATGTLPDVDLTPFAGYRMGVSRRHSQIRYNDGGVPLKSFDLGSSNGTFINGERLEAHYPYRIRHGDNTGFRANCHAGLFSKPICFWLNR